MARFYKDFLSAIIIFIVAFILVSDLFIQVGEPVTFDGPTHITLIAQYHKAFSEGDFLVRWTDGFANYGLPMGVFAQQTVSILGGLITFITSNVILSYNIVLFLGAFFSSLFFYIFLRIYFRSEAALTGAILFNFASYRIINIYIRGAAPEFFATIFISLILISLYLLIEKRKVWGGILLTVSCALLSLTHPFVVVIAGVLFIFYFFFLLLHQKKDKLKLFISSGIFALLGFGLASYYLIPLFLEIKYLYYGLIANPYMPNQFLTLQSFFDPRWFYYYKNDVAVRGNFLKFDLFESLIYLTGFGFVVYRIIKTKKIKFDLLFITVLAGIPILFLLIPFSELIYKNISILGNIQHPWRFLTIAIFIPPIILAYFINKYPKTIYIVGVILVILLLRVPQIYGKNYTLYPSSHYYFTAENLYSNDRNTIWSGNTLEYPVKKQKPEIISGNGKILSENVLNSKREYKVNASTNIEMADYTFYFPGWNVYVDGAITPIQFQNPEYRGVITYTVPSGVHDVKILFEDTKIRKLAGIGSVMSTFFFIIASIIFIKFPSILGKAQTNPRG